MQQPNIIYLHSHDTGRYIQPYGHAIHTPNLQKLAEEGVLFRQNFCINPTCSASRSALLTGCFPHENGMTGLVNRGWSLNDYSKHVIHTLHKAGYTSALAGVQHLAPNSEEKKAWQIIGYEQHLKGDICEQAASFLNNPPDKPFFLTVGFGQTHRGFPPLEEAPDDPRYCLPPAPLPDTPETRVDMVRYKASARSLDDKMGQVIAALDKSPVADNTLVICTTDHGIAFPRMKCNLQDSGIGVMLIMRGPGGFTGGKVVDEMVSHLDIFPTLCDLAGIDHPSWLRGQSLLPLMNDDAQKLHDDLFFEVNYHASYEPMRAIRTDRWKYIKRFDGRNHPVLPNCDRGESKSVWMDNGWSDTSVTEEYLFDLIFDPNETNNLAQSPDHASTLQEMQERLQKWMTDTDDPLLKGDIPAPEGTIVNGADEIHPHG